MGSNLLLFYEQQNILLLRFRNFGAANAIVGFFMRNMRQYAVALSCYTFVMAKENIMACRLKNRLLTR